MAESDWPAPRYRVLLAICLLAVAGGALDAWVYLTHGHVFANAQSGNVVLIGLALAAGDGLQVLRHLPPLAAFSAGLLASRFGGLWLKRRGANSRTIRLGVECVLLVMLSAVARRLPDSAVTASVGFLAAVQSTSLSHIGRWSFNTGIVTGDLRSAVGALAAAAGGKPGEWMHAAVVGALCLAFGGGAWLGGWCAPRLGAATLLPVAALAAAAAFLSHRAPDPLPAWQSA